MHVALDLLKVRKIVRVSPSAGQLEVPRDERFQKSAGPVAVEHGDGTPVAINYAKCRINHGGREHFAAVIVETSEL